MQITINLYRELLFSAVFLLLILLYNSIVLYKRKLSDKLSLMLLFAIIMCGFEIMWDYCSGCKSLKVLSYIGGCGYVMFFILFGIFFNQYILEQFGVLPKKKLFHLLFYRLPVIVFFIICITTPWTRLLLWVDEKGVVQERVLFGTLFYLLLTIYLIPSITMPLYYAIWGYRKKQKKSHVAKSLFIFSILCPIQLVMQLLLLGDYVDEYMVLSLAISISLVYLVSEVSINALLEKQAQVEAVESELRIAAKIQTDALPPEDSEFSKYLSIDMRAIMSTAREVGGDFYDYFIIDENRICFLIADVSGKGTPAALFMMTTKTMIKDYALTCGNTADIFTLVNARLSENNKAGMFATAWIGILDIRTMMLQYTNAGHNYPVLKVKGEGSLLLKKKHGLFLGGMDDTVYKYDEIKMNPGDRILLYTDGVTEAHDKNGGLYGKDRLFAVIDESANKENKELLDDILSDVNGFAIDVPQFDDITMIVLSIKE